MDIKFSKDSGENQQQVVAEEKGKQNLLLVVLLVLVCGFGYVYFFTGLIKPQQEQKPVEAPQAQLVKKPLPSPDGKPVKAEPEAAPAAVVATKPEKQEPVKAVEEPKKVEAPKTAEKKPLPVAAKVDEKKPAQTEKKPAPAPEKKAAGTPEKKPLPVAAGDSKTVASKKPVEKKVDKVVAADKKDTLKTERKASAAQAVLAESGGSSAGWKVLVGNYVLEEALVSDLVRVRKAGLEANVVPGGQKKTKMNRLLLAEFTDRDAAQAQLEKLKRHTSDAFIIDGAGKHLVYAGSYLLDARADSEKERLAAAGFNLTLKRADVYVATKNLTAGNFADKKAADDTMKKLKAAGIKAAVVRE
jgi:cell division protein FtsN